MEDLKSKLDALEAEYNAPAFIEHDPVKFARMFADKRDIEVAAFLASMIAWGRREQINNSCQKLLFDIMGGEPYKYVMGDKWKELNPDININRTFWGHDLQYMCKGLQWAFNLMLRWLVRNDGKVDLGIWREISPSDLCIPLDVHVAESARELGLLKRKQNDRKAVEELTDRLRAFDPQDPVRYDFALFGYSLRK